MEKMLLMRPDASYLEEASAYRAEFLAAGSSMDGTGMLRQTDAAEWLRLLPIYENPQTVPKPLVPATQLIYVRAADCRLVGMLQVRHFLNDYLRLFGGHIGYSVRPSERRGAMPPRCSRPPSPSAKASALTASSSPASGKMRPAAGSSSKTAASMKTLFVIRRKIRTWNGIG